MPPSAQEETGSNFPSIHVPHPWQDASHKYTGIVNPRSTRAEDAGSLRPAGTVIRVIPNCGRVFDPKTKEGASLSRKHLAKSSPTFNISVVAHCIASIPLSILGCV